MSGRTPALTSPGWAALGAMTECERSQALAYLMGALAEAARRAEVLPMVRGALDTAAYLVGLDREDAAARAAEAAAAADDAAGVL